MKVVLAFILNVIIYIVPHYFRTMDLILLVVAPLPMQLLILTICCLTLDKLKLIHGKK